MVFQIRQAALDDLDLVIELWQNMRHDHDKIVIDGGKDKKQIEIKSDAITIFRNYALSLIQSDDSVIFLIYVDNKIAGYNVLTINNNIPVFKIEKIGYISDLFLKKAYRGKGFSTKIKDNAIKWFKSKGIDYISLKVHPENSHAHEIYKKWGFKDFHIEMRKRLL